MADNFNIHEWNRSRLLESNLEDSDRKAKERVDIIVNQISKDFPEEFDSPLKKSELRFAVTSAMVDLTLKGLLRENQEQEYKVEYWINTPDGYDNEYIKVKATSEEEAIEKAQQDPSTRRGKKFKIYKESVNENEDPIDTIAMDVPLFIRLLEYAREDAETDMDLHNLTEKAIKQTKMRGVLSMEDYTELVGEGPELSPIKETISFILENLKGYSDYFPGGKTKGLTTDELSDILMNIVKDIEDEGKQLDESTLCKRGQDYIKARKAAGEKSSAYLSGRAVKVCKGDIKFKGKKVDSYN